MTWTDLARRRRSAAWVPGAAEWRRGEGLSNGLGAAAMVTTQLVLDEGEREPKCAAHRPVRAASVGKMSRRSRPPRKRGRHGDPTTRVREARPRDEAQRQGPCQGRAAGGTAGPPPNPPRTAPPRGGARQ